LVFPYVNKNPAFSMAENTGVFSGDIRAFKSCRALFGKWRKSLKFRADVSSGIFGFAVFERALDMRRQPGPTGQQLRQNLGAVALMPVLANDFMARMRQTLHYFWRCVNAAS